VNGGEGASLVGSSVKGGVSIVGSSHGGGASMED
jgi:hypothetical protein